MPFDTNFILSKLDQSAQTIAALRGHAGVLEAAGRTVRSCLHNGGKVFSCGNGGSAAQAMHLTEEIVGRYRNNRAAMPALCLNADPTALTCIANDFGFDEIFARQLAAFGTEGDVLVALSTSGKSPNVIRTLERARALKVTTIGLLGKGGGPAAAMCDLPVIVPSEYTEHIQEAHQVILHLLLEAIEFP